MASEFNIKNGFISNSDSRVLGTLTATTVYAGTLSATTYQNLPLDINVTGGTYSAISSTIIFTNNTGGTFNVTGITTNGDYLPLSGGTVTGATIFTNGLSANTISATTITATTFYGSGSGLTDIPIASVTNLTTELSNKFDKTGGTVTGSVIITQNVTVLGTATTINTQTLSIADNVVTLNSNYSAGTPFFGHSGVEVLRGSGTTAAMLWEEQNSQWEAGLHGSTRKIILSGDSLSYLSSGHTHPISEITNLQTNLNDKLSKSTGGTVVANTYFTNGLTASTTSADETVIPFASVAIYDNEPPTGTGIGGFFDASLGNAVSKYSLQLKDGTEGIDKVLVSKTTDGKANWSNNLNVNQLYANTISATTYQNLPIPYGLINAISSGNYLI